LTCASRTGGAGAVHRLGLCQALETKSSVGHSQTQCRCALCTRTLHTRARSQRVPRDHAAMHAARALHVTGRSAAAGRSPGHIFRDTLMWRLVTLTLVGGMSRLRVRDSRLSAVSLSPLSLSRSRPPPSPDTDHSAPCVAESRHSHVTRPDFPSRGKAPAPRGRVHVVPTLDVPGYRLAHSSSVNAARAAAR